MTRTMTATLSLLALLTACSSDKDNDGDGYGSAWSDGASSGTWSSDYTETEAEDAPEETEETEEECDEVSDTALWLSPDDSNSMSSPVQIRAAVLDGWGSVSGAPVRTWELFNYYSWDYPAADEGQLQLHAAMVPTEDAATWRLQLAVSSEALENEDRPPMNIAFSVDTSGSMGGRPLSLVKDTLREVAGNLRSGDIVSMVTWNSSNTTVLADHTVTGPSDAVLAAAIDGLESGGSTDLNKGLSEAYDLALAAYESTMTNRVVLLSDGGANAGTTDIELISQHAGAEGDDGIYLVGVGVGDGSSYNDRLMDSVTDAGKGASIYVEDSEEVARIFGERFVNTMEIAAREVEVELVLPPGFEIVSFSGEELSENRDEVEPQNIAPNDAMVFHNVIRTCAPEAVGDDSTVQITLFYKDAVTWAEKSTTLTLSWAELLAADPAPVEKGAALMAYADAIKAHKGLDVGMTEDEALRLAFETVEQALVSNPGDADLAEVAAVLGAL